MINKRNFISCFKKKLKKFTKNLKVNFILLKQYLFECIFFNSLDDVKNLNFGYLGIKATAADVALICQ